MLRGAVPGRAVFNGPDFEPLIGVYGTLFFVMAQVLNRIRFGHAPTTPICAGDGLIVAGGLLVAFWGG
jgi:small multidrug resistance family-3 protein